ncbi:MAG TPA: molybdenum ABC transporter ATP-binding protein [Candidatus Binataceae bacterium]|nr:molybdenum ABC transporter ATP-binding protein [Candidatus Binataceae bacterium]
MLSVDVTKRLSAEFAVEAKFDAPAGFTMLLGPSGAGKTTLLNCIAGLWPPDHGQIQLGARTLFDSTSGIAMAPRERRIGYLFQHLALFPHLSVAQNVGYGLARLPAAERETRVSAVLESFCIPHLRRRKPGQISGGERQRVALARTLVTEPAALLLDEPLSALDTATRTMLLDDLRAWNARYGIPILYVTHAPEEAFALGERVLVLASGRILDRGLPQEILTRPRHEMIAQVVGFENVFDATVKSLAESQGTMRCQLDGAVELETPLTGAAPGARVRVAIRAGDIIIATERPRSVSARNILAGTLTALRQEGVQVALQIDTGVTFEAHLTPGARDELGLEPGKAVWLVIKTYSCSVLDGW